MRSLVLLFMIVSLSGCYKLVEKKPEHFGEYGQPIDIMNTLAIEKLDGLKGGEKIQLTGIIESTCAKKGCWMNIKDENGSSVRVTFKDYGFFVPTEGVEGKETIVEGVLEKRLTSVDELRHYAEDAGKSPEEIALITEPKEEYSFIADGVVIR